MGALVKRALLLVALVALAACTKKEPPPAPTVDAEAPAPVAVAADGHTIVENACLSCHTEQMLQQQRLTEPQWAKEVTKMAGWGANLEPADTAPLVAYLADHYGPDAGAYTAPIGPADELAGTDDGAFAGGDVERGHGLYVDKCAGCHGNDAKGHIGVDLVDRPFLYRAADFARTVRKGRGKMPPQNVTDAQFADILAYLRKQR